MSLIYPYRNKRLYDLVLFDLDGTLVDTAPDLVGALNLLRNERSLAALPESDLRSEVSAGSAGLIGKGFGVKSFDTEFDILKLQFLQLYEEREHKQSELFGGIDFVLDSLELMNIPWGVVTNKPARFAVPLVERLGLDQRACCLVTPDDVLEPKPDPSSVILACVQENAEPSRTLFIGDSHADILAGKNAGTKTLTALYGYIPEGIDPIAWKSDGCVETPQEIIGWI